MHLAARQRDQEVGMLTFKRDHLDSAVNLFPALSGFKQGHLVVASTVSVHGNVPGGVFSAGTPCGSSRPYDATKLQVEELAQRMWQGQLTTCWRGCLDPPAGGSGLQSTAHPAASIMSFTFRTRQILWRSYWRGTRLVIKLRRSCRLSQSRCIQSFALSPSALSQLLG